MDAVLFDTHVHLDASPLCENLEEEVRRAREVQVRRFVVPGVRRQGWPALMECVRSVAGAVAAPGLHPLAAGEWNDEAAARLSVLLSDPLSMAVGEIGLDALVPAPSPEVQERAFRGQLRLAIEAGLPVLIHCRRATGRLMEILREENAQRVGGIFHAFSGSVETALEGVKLGFALGFGGPLTYPNARRVREVLRRVPQEAIVVETDAPDLSPHPLRGEANRPANLPLIARKVAEVRGWSMEETARITSANAARVLKIF